MSWFLKPIADAIAALTKIIVKFRDTAYQHFHLSSEDHRLILERLDRIESLLTPPAIPTPEPITVWRLLSERKEDEMFLLTYEADLPAIAESPENSDVIAQRIKVVVDGEEVSRQDLPKLAEKVTFEVQKGKTVHLERSLVDDDDNEGPSVASQDFVARDTIPPSAPGDFGQIRNIGEREVPDEE